MANLNEAPPAAASLSVPPPPGPTPVEQPLPEKPVTGTSQVGTGVHGQSFDGAGVLGEGHIGVHGVSGGDGVLGEGHIGVHGVSTGSGDGVTGSSTYGNGVIGLAAGAPTGGGTVNGVIGRTTSGSASGVWGDNTGSGYGVAGSSAHGNGVIGLAAGASPPAGVHNNGVIGITSTGTDSGVWGVNTGAGGGVAGLSATGDGVFGNSQKNGVHGLTASAGDAGVWGENTGSGFGVHGSSQNGDGVFGNSQKNGVHGLTASTGDAGVWGENTGLGVGVRGVSHNGDGVNGNAQSAAQSGVFGINLAGGSVPDNLNPPRPGGNGVWGHTTVEKGSGVVGSVDPNLQNAAGVTGIGKIAGQFFGDVHVTGDVLLTGGDCAERFDIVGSDEIVPGTVMVIEAGSSLGISKSAYDKRVAGVVSGAGDFRPGLILGNQDSQDKRLPLALVGRVCCKVDASYCRIEIGDLLTTSPTPGHAMKAADPLKAFGTVIGKALHPLESGQGLIPILVALQ